MLREYVCVRCVCCVLRECMYVCYVSVCMCVSVCYISVCMCVSVCVTSVYVCV